MWQVQTGPKTDLQNLAAGIGKQFTAVFGHKWPVQNKIAKTRKNDLRVEAQHCHRTHFRRITTLGNDPPKSQ